jgi:hypothetical protein
VVGAGLSHSIGVKTNGDLYAWGRNVDGQLGDHTTTQRNAPVLVGSGYASVAAGAHHSLGLRTGELFAWGGSVSDSIGDGHGPSAFAPLVVLNPPKPDYLAYASTIAAFTVGADIIPDVPTWSGLATSFSVSPALPEGLTIDAVTGVVSGAPTAPSPTTSYAVTATGPAGSTTGLLTITVN